MEPDFTPLALEAVLMFHASGPWDADKRLRWTNICVTVLGQNKERSSYGLPIDSWDATTRVLCDLVRAALKQRAAFVEPVAASFNKQGDAA